MRSIQAKAIRFARDEFVNWQATILEMPDEFSSSQWGDARLQHPGRNIELPRRFCQKQLAPRPRRFVDTAAHSNIPAQAAAAHSTPAAAAGRAATAASSTQLAAPVPESKLESSRSQKHIERVPSSTSQHTADAASRPPAPKRSLYFEPSYEC